MATLFELQIQTLLFDTCIAMLYTDYTFVVYMYVHAPTQQQQFIYFPTISLLVESLNRKRVFLSYCC